MGVRIIQADSRYNTETGAVLFCSVSMTAFGPIFEDGDEAQAFLDWLGDDPRGYSSKGLHDKYDQFRQQKNQEGEP